MVVHGGDWISVVHLVFLFFFQAEDGIRDLVRSRGLGDVYKRQLPYDQGPSHPLQDISKRVRDPLIERRER